MQRVWQIAAGEPGRKYGDLFLQHDVMFCGPGRFGPFDDTAYTTAASSGWVSAWTLAAIRRFAQEVSPGDIVLLRSGYRVEAIGHVPEQPYFHTSTFDDVFGWDLEHVCRVIWQQELADELAEIQSAGPLFASRKQIPTFTAVSDLTILEPIQHLFEWYRSSNMAGDRPTEHEVVAHIILPMLLALGWSEQLLAVEWRKIDLAVFNSTPTDHARCRLVCEAKGMGHGLQNVFQQAARYIDTLQLAACHKILLADGGRSYLYRRGPEGSWQDQPSGYLNVLKIRENHLLPADTNAVDTIVALTPACISE